MMQKFIYIIIGFVCVSQLSQDAHASEAIDAAKQEFDAEVERETEEFFNSIFKTQIDFFTKVKSELPATAQRIRDIEKYVTRLGQATQQKNLDMKDEMWRDIFLEANKSPLVLNNESETGLTDLQYRELLDRCGLKTLVENSLADIASYFWKMAKASGKVMGATVDDYVDRFRKH